MKMKINRRARTINILHLYCNIVQRRVAGTDTNKIILIIYFLYRKNYIFSSRATIHFYKN